jgi:hypothetical protein
MVKEYIAHALHPKLLTLGVHSVADSVGIEQNEIA